MAYMIFRNLKKRLCKIKSRAHIYFAPLLMILPFSGCVHNPPSYDAPLEKVSFKNLIGWEHEDYTTLISLMWRQCHRFSQLPVEADLGGSARLPSGRFVGSWSNVCAALPQSEQVSSEEARVYFETWFQPYLIKRAAFYTGYYEPEIEASLEHIGGYNFPIYHRPSDLIRTRDKNGKIVFGRDVNGVVQPYDDRAKIDSGSLSGKRLEAAWLKDPIDLFFLQIQGSGRLRLPNGQIVRVAYDGQNGQDYVPIGKILLQKGALRLDDINESSIRNWLHQHPEQVKEILEKNPNYVFFRLVEHSTTEGPVGAFGLPLITGRSLAVDRHFVPFASLIWVQTPMPEIIHNGEGEKRARWHHLAFAQDIGNDIHGAARADIFTGWGEKAHFLAGHLHEKGEMFLLLPRQKSAEEQVLSHSMREEQVSAAWAAQKTQ